MCAEASREPNFAQWRVVLCGDALTHSTCWNSLAQVGFSLVRCSEDLDTAVVLCGKLNPSLLVARQAFIEELSSADFMQLTNFRTGTSVLAILEHECPEASAEMLRRGCRGVLAYPFPPKLLCRAMLTILDGELWAPRRVVAALLSDLLREGSAKKENCLTPQEERILELILQGRKNSAIAEALFISPETVRWHKRRLYRKVGRPDLRKPADSESRLVELSSGKAL